MTFEVGDYVRPTDGPSCRRGEIGEVVRVPDSNNPLVGVRWEDAVAESWSGSLLAPASAIDRLGRLA